ncbi:MAG: G1 family glutamic endopeptidase [Streptosporangiaceae bacterium]
MNLRPWLAAAAAAALALGASSAASAATTTAQQGVIHPAGWHAVATKGFHLAKNVHLPRTAAQHLTSKGTDYSYNWAGYVTAGDKGVSFRYVTANFYVPSVDCAASPVGTLGTYEGQWIGFDGFDNDTVEQVGIGAECVSGTPEYYAWYEMGQSAPVTYTGPINPGDGITASVYYNDSNHEYTLYLRDDSTGGDINALATCPSSSCPDASAEVISEAPGGGPGAGYDLADFTTESFNSAGVTSHDGYHGSLAASKLWSSNEIVMEDASGVYMVEPSSLQGGGDFNDTWLAGS